MATREEKIQAAKAAYEVFEAPAYAAYKAIKDPAYVAYAAATGPAYEAFVAIQLSATDDPPECPSCAALRARVAELEQELQDSEGREG